MALKPPDGKPGPGSKSDAGGNAIAAGNLAVVGAALAGVDSKTVALGATALQVGAIVQAGEVTLASGAAVGISVAALAGVDAKKVAVASAGLQAYNLLTADKVSPIAGANLAVTVAGLAGANSNAVAMAGTALQMTALGQAAGNLAAKFKAHGKATTNPTDNLKRKEVLIAPYFDEQILFENAQGHPITNTRYKVTLEDGSTREGITDRFGKTERILTLTPLAVKDVQLYPSPAASACFCNADHDGADGHEPQAGHEPEAGTEPVAAQPPKAPVQAAAAPKAAAAKKPAAKKKADTKTAAAPVTVPVAGVKTNPTKLGSSVTTVKTPIGQSRHLTAGEINMAKVLFKDAIDYSKVMVHNDEFLPFGWQRDNTAMTPNGHIYYGKRRYADDFSVVKEPTRLQVFIHEMVHVWQHQLGYPVMLRGAERISLTYDYELRADRTLSDYDMEQQGEILSDYWAFLWGNGKPALIVEKQHLHDFPLYQKVLASFIANPRDKRNLPSYFHQYADPRDPKWVEGRSKM